jgi:collagenase-like PrtC family protease
VFILSSRCLREQGDLEPNYEGKWSRRVEIGVQQRGELVVAYSGQCRLAGAWPGAVRRRGLQVVKN